MLCLALQPRQKVQKLDFQKKFSMSKIIRIFLIFFSMKNKILGAHFWLELFSGNFNFKTTLFTKNMSNFWRGHKAMESNQAHL